MIHKSLIKEGWICNIDPEKQHSKLYQFLKEGCEIAQARNPNTGRVLQNTHLKGVFQRRNDIK